MNIIQLNDDGEVKLFCPFCGKKVIDPEKEWDECPHTLFIATNEGGFEHISPKIEINEEFDQPEDEDEDELSLDEYIETIEHPEAVCFEIAQFSGFSAFIGFGKE
jgi:hypothetical protein